MGGGKNWTPASACEPQKIPPCPLLAPCGKKILPYFRSARMSLFDYVEKKEKKSEGNPGNEKEAVEGKKSTRRKAIRKAVKKPNPEPPDSEPELPEVRPLTISELTLRIKGAIERDFSEILVLGEISNLTTPRSGHVYLSLKDDSAQLPCVAWKNTVSRLNFKLQNGMEIIARGRLEVYPPQGKYQMILTHLEPKGIGVLELAFRELRAKLAAEGLFDPSKKRPIPPWIRTVAVLTSPSGAALRDFLQVLGRRTRRVDVRIVPVKVQGEGAAEEIAHAIGEVNRLRWADCIVITRGGGSAEDLWAFNEEPLVRAVAGSVLPTISAVGHEIDVSLCDLAADLRALTPSEAAERIAPEDSRLYQNLEQYRRFLEDRIERHLALRKDRISALLLHPGLKRPERFVEDRRRPVDLLEQALDRNTDQLLDRFRQNLAKHAASLQALSPLSIFERGYSITKKADGTLLRSTRELQIDETLYTRLKDGTIRSTVEEIGQ